MDKEKIEKMLETIKELVQMDGAPWQMKMKLVLDASTPAQRLALNEFICWFPEEFLDGREL